ncbi:hypothetical protein JCM19235_1964 [Vibrio maritimus]|uniref:Uncharacterized protein n=1 Tax=Vibrio maritimus TaxID=990268 RepID=A0A090RTF1_9VIBR|nr:hypothetical protein JCM19235_1964 [Vibrio maritimus]
MQLKTVPITIPANWTGTVYLKGRIRHAGVSGSSATVALSGNMIDGTQAMAQLFKSGSDLA